jgi:hypothetical protein
VNERAELISLLRNRVADISADMDTLARFVDSNKYWALHPDEQAICLRQLRAMNDYIDALSERIEYLS